MSFKDSTVKELKKLLQDMGLSIPPNAVKQDLIKILEDEMLSVENVLKETGLNEDDMFEDGVLGSDGPDVVQEDDAPSIFSPEWHDHVMSHFEKNELIDGNPVCAGLRRVAEFLLGDIVETGPTQVDSPTDSDGPGRATVVYKVVFNWMNSGVYKTFSEAADVWHGNTDDLFCAHPVATACTRAEGRALRKALKLRVLAAEELAKKNIVEIVQRSIEKTTDGSYNSDDRISSQQINFLDNRCKQLDLNVMGFISIGEKVYRSINDVTRESATKMIGVLNGYQNNTDTIPENILGYQSDWRN